MSMNYPKTITYQFESNPNDFQKNEVNDGYSERMTNPPPIILCETSKTRNSNNHSHRYLFYPSASRLSPYSNYTSNYNFMKNPNLISNNYIQRQDMNNKIRDENELYDDGKNETPRYNNNQPINNNIGKKNSNRSQSMGNIRDIEKYQAKFDKSFELMKTISDLIPEEDAKVRGNSAYYYDRDKEYDKIIEKQKNFLKNFFKNNEYNSNGFNSYSNNNSPMEISKTRSQFNNNFQRDDNNYGNNTRNNFDNNNNNGNYDNMGFNSRTTNNQGNNNINDNTRMNSGNNFNDRKNNINNYNNNSGMNSNYFNDTNNNNRINYNVDNEENLNNNYINKTADDTNIEQGLRNNNFIKNRGVSTFPSNSNNYVNDINTNNNNIRNNSNNPQVKPKTILHKNQNNYNNDNYNDNNNERNMNSNNNLNENNTSHFINKEDNEENRQMNNFIRNENNIENSDNNINTNNISDNKNQPNFNSGMSSKSTQEFYNTKGIIRNTNNNRNQNKPFSQTESRLNENSQNLNSNSNPNNYNNNIFPSTINTGNKNGFTESANYIQLVDENNNPVQDSEGKPFVGEKVNEKIEQDNEIYVKTKKGDVLKLSVLRGPEDEILLNKGYALLGKDQKFYIDKNEPIVLPDSNFAKNDKSIPIKIKESDNINNNEFNDSNKGMMNNNIYNSTNNLQYRNPLKSISGANQNLGNTYNFYSGGIGGGGTVEFKRRHASKNKSKLFPTGDGDAKPPKRKKIRKKSKNKK